LRSFSDPGNDVKTSKIPYRLILLGSAWLLGMFLLVPVDYEWTLFLRQHRIAWFARWMAQSLFEGNPLGGGDPVIFFLVLVAVVYYSAWKKGPASRFYVWRPHLGFILVTAWTNSILMVHSLKWVMGRARPSYVVKGLLPFSDWFKFGPQFITQGTYRGSLPSGHTAQVFILMTMAYLLLLSPPRFKYQRLVGWTWGGFSLLYTLLMGLSRCMQLSHWFSDIVFAAGMSWILMHVIYYHLLRVPDQEAYYQRMGRFPARPRAWEIRLCLILLGSVVGGMTFALGVRAFLLGSKWIWPAAFLPLGTLMAFYFSRKSVQFVKRVRTHFNCTKFKGQQP
jgi:membrane-associated phospholipid phosphatase